MTLAILKADTKLLKLIVADNPEVTTKNERRITWKEGSKQG